MKIAIELHSAQTEQLQTIAASLGVAAEELAQAAVADLVSARGGLRIRGEADSVEEP